MIRPTKIMQFQEYHAQQKNYALMASSFLLEVDTVSK
jgi:hypothetical protein